MKHKWLNLNGILFYNINRENGCTACLFLSCLIAKIILKLVNKELKKFLGALYSMRSNTQRISQVLINFGLLEFPSR